MALIDTPRVAPFGAITAYRIVTVFEKAIAAIRAWHISHVTEEELSRLSDSQLDDIGLHRGWIGQFSDELAARR